MSCVITEVIRHDINRSKIKFYEIAHKYKYIVCKKTEDNCVDLENSRRYQFALK